MAIQTNKLAESLINKIFNDAGITINGNQPHDIKVADSSFYLRVLKDGSLGLGESYMDGQWQCDDLAEMMNRFSRKGLATKFKYSLPFITGKLMATLINQGNKANAIKGVTYHYDIGNDLYEAMLDESLQYTCAIWENATSLKDAQLNKMKLLCEKLQLKPGMRVLDIGCGWGGLARFARKNYGAEFVGISLSKEQLDLARVKNGMDKNEFLLMDWRNVTGKFDRIVSVGMFEHVCYKNHRPFFEKALSLLNEDGLLVLHTMGRKKTVVKSNDQWITKYIFPNTQVPSIADFGLAVDGLFVMEDWENLSVNYEKTLLAWNENFLANYHLLPQDKYDERFHRMWTYYLQMFAGWYRSRALQLWQIVLSPSGIPGGYEFSQARRSKTL